MLNLVRLLLNLTYVFRTILFRMEKIDRDPVKISRNRDLDTYQTADLVHSMIKSSGSSKLDDHQTFQAPRRIPLQSDLGSADQEP